jgi:hypothetical protein
MKKTNLLMSIGAGLLLAAAAYAQVPADAPAGTTGLCKDGTYYSGATKKGACRGHKGVKDWYAATTAAPAAPTAPTPKSPAPVKSAPPANAAPGGGPGLVWVNTSTKVYHCQGDRWYGKTKQGEYMSQADAKTKGNRPDHGKDCP